MSPTTSITTRCPSWCAAPEHHVVAGDVLHDHEIEAAPGVTVEIAQTDHCTSASIYVNHPGPDDDLTSSEARQVAAALLQAADLVEGRAAAALVVEDGGDRISFHLPAWLTPAQRHELRRCTSVLWSALVASQRMGADA